MLLHTYPTMKNAHKFYNKNGFVETTGEDQEQIHVVKNLTPTIELKPNILSRYKATHPIM